MEKHIITAMDGDNQVRRSGSVLLTRVPRGALEITAGPMVMTGGRWGGGGGRMGG